jgi:hypothetical protein
MFRIHPGNILQVEFDTPLIKRYALLLSASVGRVLPIVIARVTPNLYSIAHADTLALLAKKDPQAPKKYMQNIAPEVRPGLELDLTTGECLNGELRRELIADTTMRKQWLRALRKFKMGLKARAKIGVFDKLCLEVGAQRAATGNWRKPDWTGDVWLSMLCEAIRTETFPTDLLKGFAQTADVSYWRQELPTPDKAIEAADVVCNELSIELRKRFGVFGNQHKE